MRFCSFSPTGVVVERTRLEFSGGRAQLVDGQNEIEFDVSISSMSGAADARGSGLWKMTTFTTPEFNGQGARSIIDSQTLSGGQSSQSLTAGGRTTFRNLAASISSDEVPCDETMYMCVEISRGDAPSVDYTLNGAYEDSMISCEKLRCAVKAPRESWICRGFG